MAALPVGSQVPWQRVVNRLGKVSLRTDGEGNLLQRNILEAEGICFDADQRINLANYGWDFADLS
jgi:methylated-DNA-protein-cysteine methyltransferase-like protein